MQNRKKELENFVDWFKRHIKGYERGEGQLFFNQLLQAFGNAGVLEAGAALEDRVRKRKGTTGFADFVWKPRVIIELKERGTALSKHYEQAFEYWMTLVPNRPKYMALCNFDEFWIYDLNTQLNDPVHVLKTENLANDWGALAFLLPREEKPIFNNNNVEVTEAAAKIVGSMYFSLSKRKVDPVKAQRFVLQLVVALFAEDVDLIPKYTIHKILNEAVKNPVTQKELTSLFEAMSIENSSKKPVKYKGISYFNGGIFNEVDAVELNFKEIDFLYQASKQDWSKVRPSIFGAIFEASMDPKERHGHGIHYTSELDIQKIVNPTIVKPFRERIQAAKSKKDLAEILKDIREFKVLDPACGSGNFLYISFRELRRLEIEVMEMIAEKEKSTQVKLAMVSPKNFYGIDTNGFGLELAKVALCIGRKLSADEFKVVDNILPFENLDENFIKDDALFIKWPDADAIIGNPPFQSKNRIKKELGVVYLAKLRRTFSKVPGLADYCVYWFHKAHANLKPNAVAGLVGTNTIRENQSRVGGLDFIVNNNGTIIEAVSSQVWSGDAVVHVSIVNWKRGTSPGLKKLFFQNGDSTQSPWSVHETDCINSSLSNKVDVSGAKRLAVNIESNSCYQGQTHGHSAFLLKRSEAEKILKNPIYCEILHPYLTADEMLRLKNLKPIRFVIDFQGKNLIEARRYSLVYKQIEKFILPDRECAAKEEEKNNKLALNEDKKTKLNHHHKNFYNKWWQLSYPREELIEKISVFNRYIVCPQHPKRPIFEFVSNKIRPNAALMVFTFQDDYSFGVLQSSIHWTWIQAKGSTLKGDNRYTSNTVFDTFPWPQNVTLEQCKNISDLSRKLRLLRRALMRDGSTNLRGIYQSMDLPGENPLKKAHEDLDKAVCFVYGFKYQSDYLKELLDLNLSIAKAEKDGKEVQGPGLPKRIKNPKSLITDDCIEPE